MLNNKALKTFLFKEKTRQGYPQSPQIYNIVLEVLGGAIRQ